MKLKLRKLQYAIIAITLASSLAGSNSMASSWWETIKFKGDFRYRHEMIDQDGKDNRTRHRIRTRFGFVADVSTFTKVGIQLASGSDDPVSTNQTLDDASSTKQIGLDLAYFSTIHDQLPGFKLTAGKMKNPFFKPGKSKLIWDSDWNPEGAVLAYTKKSDQFGVALSGGGFWIDERSSDKNSFLTAVQGIVDFYFNEKKTDLKIGGSVFNFANSKGYQPFYDNDDSFGNSVVDVRMGIESAFAYANEYELFELFGELTLKVGSTPVTILGDYVTNNAVDSLGAGWVFGVRVGKAKKTGSWQFRYIFKQLERDAVLGVMTDSDFIGGGTDGKGHEFGGAVQLATNTTFKITYYINEIGIDATSPVDYNRLQADLQLKF